MPMDRVGAVPSAQRYVFSGAPRMVYWETTRACNLACRHCRANAISRRDPGELSTGEARSLPEEIAAFGPPMPHVVFTGGDPLQRRDLEELIAYGRERGLAISLAPSVTPLLTRERLAAVVAAGAQSISLSLDGATPATHDTFRGVSGTFVETLTVAHWVADLSVPLQLNTLVTAETVNELPAVYRLALTMAPMRWSLFFLVAMGRGQALQGLSPADAETVLHWVYTVAREAPFAVAATEAPHYRRIVFEQMRAEGLTPAQVHDSALGRGFGIRDGNGVMFISHTGQVTPTGFLPVVTGNVRTASLVELYHHHEAFMVLRDAGRLHGKCSRCEYRWICGGSRARAYAHTGDYLASDPLCAYQP